MRNSRAIWLVLGWFALALCGVRAQDSSEEAADYFERWLRQDVVYIVSEEERDVFRSLSTDDERNRFIEDFWRRRDTDPNTAVNEFREEHYRRIAYANEKFAAGKPGWKTDRGMIYIKFGPPDRRQTNPTGGRVYRTKQELIASPGRNPEQHMTALPYEIWEYREIEGLGEEIEFEFVAKEGGVDYTLALSPEDKDALFFNTGSNLPETRARTRGLKTFKANPLDRLETLAAAQRPPPARVPEEFVTARVHFSEMPFEIETDSAPAGEGMFDCRVALKVPHSSLSFEPRLDKYRAALEVEIFVRDIRKLVVAHRSDRLVTELDVEELKRAGRESSVYNTVFRLPPGRYLAEVWIRDTLGGNASFDSKLVVTPGESGPEPQDGGPPRGELSPLKPRK